jgi:hypothetical protein
VTIGMSWAAVDCPRDGEGRNPVRFRGCPATVIR